MLKTIWFCIARSLSSASNACAENHNKYESTDITPSLWNTFHVSCLSINLSVHPLILHSASGQHKLLLFLLVCLWEWKNACGETSIQACQWLKNESHILRHKKGNGKANSESINMFSLDVFNFNITEDILKQSHCSSITLYLHKFRTVNIINYTNTACNLCRWRLVLLFHITVCISTSKLS